MYINYKNTFIIFNDLYGFTKDSVEEKRMLIEQA